MTITLQFKPAVFRGAMALADIPLWLPINAMIGAQLLVGLPGA